MNYADNDNHDQFTTTQATTVTTTKSPEQIIKEKEAIIYSVTLKEQKVTRRKLSREKSTISFLYREI